MAAEGARCARLGDARRYACAIDCSSPLCFRPPPHSPDVAGTWSSYVIASGDSFTKVDVDITKAQVETVAASVLPLTTAKHLLDDFAKLTKGEGDERGGETGGQG